jgi:outer membrane protein OmpA-like peptidoglycan-associated protein
MSLLAGCALCPPPPPKAPPPVDYVVLLPNADGTVGKVFVKGQQGEQSLVNAGWGAALNGAVAAAAVPQDQLLKDFGEALGARPMAPENFYLYFESGGAKLTADSLALIPTILAKVAARESADVSVVGHSDTVGKADANAKLAYQRAATIARLLRERGMLAASFSVESHGESNLLVATPDETPEPRNRRVEISIR